MVISEAGVDRERTPMSSAGSREALQVLTLAHRTAEQHIADATREAAGLREEAEKAAASIAQGTEIYGTRVRREAEGILASARSASEDFARATRQQAEAAKLQAGQIISDAHKRAELIIGDATESADQLLVQADERYQDSVGGLAAKREQLQQQIEALEHFDREYRKRLMTFMQGQIRTLWTDPVPEPGRASRAGRRAPVHVPAQVNGRATFDTPPAGDGPK